MSTRVNIEVGKRIREIRLMKGFTINEFSERADISSSFLRMVENGKKGLSAETLHSVARALNVTSDCLLYGVEHPDKRLDLAEQALAAIPADKHEPIRILLDMVSDLIRKLDE